MLLQPLEGVTGDRAVAKEGREAWSNKGGLVQQRVRLRLGVG
jgi:hypothetical protein